MNKLSIALILSLSLSMLSACGEEDDPDDVEPNVQPTVVEVIGEWSDSFGGMPTISATKWDADTIVEFDNTKNIAIVQAAPDDMFNPNKFSRYVWTDLKDGGFYYCTEVFGKDTAALAKADPATSDATAPDTGGCGGFPWTKMSPR
jgi:hypothetical protein